MTRHTFGGDAASFVVAVAPDGTLSAAGGVVVTFATAVTGGSVVTDLLASNGTTPITSVTTNADGTMSMFYGPDGTTQLWAIVPGRATRLLLTNNDLAATFAAITPAPSGVPAQPVAPTAVASAAAATVSFLAPANGGSPIDNYRVTTYSGGGITTGTASPIIVSSLTNGTAYTFTVTAHNVNGWGPESAQSNSVTPSAGGGAVPSAPTQPLALGEYTNSHLFVKFKTPASDGGSSIDSYRVTCTQGGLATTTVAPASAPVDSLGWRTVTLTPNSTGFTGGVGNTSTWGYQFTIAAHNANGWGAESGTCSSKPQDGVNCGAARPDLPAVTGSGLPTITSGSPGAPFIVRDRTIGFGVTVSGHDIQFINCIIQDASQGDVAFIGNDSTPANKSIQCIDCSLVPASIPASSFGGGGTGVKFIRCSVYGQEDGFRNVGSNMTVDSCIQDCQPGMNGVGHGDSMQQLDGPSPSVRFVNTTLRGGSSFVFYNDSVDGNGVSWDGLVIDGCWMYGGNGLGGQTDYCFAGKAPQSLTNVTVRNSRFGAISSGTTNCFGAGLNYGNVTFALWSNNAWDATGNTTAQP